MVKLSLWGNLVKNKSAALATGILLAASLAVAVAGCTTGASTAGSGSPTSKPTPTPTAAADRTYTSADLADILTAVKKDIASSGTVTTDSEVKAELAKSGGAKSLLTTKGITFSPASCRDKLLAAIPEDPSKLPDGTPSIVAALTDTGRSVTVASADSAPLPASLTSKFESSATDALSSCSSIRLSLTVAGHTTSIEMKLKKIDLTTTATQTVALQETVAFGGQNEVIDSVQAIDGNLVIGVNGVVTGGDTSSLASLVDKTVAAAKALK